MSSPVLEEIGPGDQLDQFGIRLRCLARPRRFVGHHPDAALQPALASSP